MKMTTRDHSVEVYRAEQIKALSEMVARHEKSAAKFRAEGHTAMVQQFTDQADDCRTFIAMMQA